MRTFNRLFLTTFLSMAFAAPLAHADSGSLAIKADVQVSAQTQASTGDAAYAKGDFEAALEAYGEGFATTRDTAFVYAMAKCHEQLGHADEAKSMFQMYLAAKGDATLKYESNAKAELGMKAEGAATGAVGTVTGAVGKVKDTAFKASAGIYTAAKVSVSAKVKASAKAEAKAADEAYASAKYEDAAKGYAEAYAKSQQAILLWAAAQSNAQAGHGVEARAQLEGYLATKPKGQAKKDANALLLAMGGSSSAVVKVAVKAKVSAKAKGSAGKGDKAMKSGQYVTAAKVYADAYAKTSDAALLYAEGMAQFYAGMTADAAATLQSYLAAGGTLEFQAQAQATLKATGQASS
jgi:tetratricopeptide (TPR) repeat protein